MAKRSLGIGVIGAGMIGLKHIENLNQVPGVRVLWAADPCLPALERAGKQFDIPNLTADYSEMLKDKQVDAVVICTPPTLHAQQAIAVMRAGKHLMLEKPMATEPRDARRIVAEAGRHPELVATDCSARHARLNPKFAIVRKLIEEGALGRVYFVHHRSIGRQRRPGIEYNPSAKWFLDRKIAGGGPLYDWGVYDLSFHLGVLGEPKFLRARTGFCINGLDRVDPGTDVFSVEEHGAVLMEFVGGLRYYWERATNAHGAAPNETRIYGTKGGVRLGYCTWNAPEVIHSYVDNDGRGKAQERVVPVDMTGHKDDLAELDMAFVRAVRGQGPVPMPMELAMKNLEIIQRVYRATGWC